METVWHENAKNAYYARHRIQQHYNGETYQMQLDSHHRFVKGWDTKVIEMLHKCDAGEYSVLTVYGPEYPESHQQQEYWESERFKQWQDNGVAAMILAYFQPDGELAFQPFNIKTN